MINLHNPLPRRLFLASWLLSALIVGSVIFALSVEYPEPCPYYQNNRVDVHPVIEVGAPPEELSRHAVPVDEHDPGCQFEHDGELETLPVLRPVEHCPAPGTFRVVFETTAGDFTIEVYRHWAPLGADRLHYLAAHGFYDDVAFYRSIEDFVVQFGIHADPQIDQTWRKARFADDPVSRTNERGTVSFAHSGTDSRSTQLFINRADNEYLDVLENAPVAKVIDGMDVVDELYSGYGDAVSHHQPEIQRQGNAFLKSQYPNLDYVVSTRVEY